MARVAVIVGNMFEDVEYTVPVSAFREAGHQVVNVGLEEGAIVLGKKEGSPVRIDASVADVGSGDFDALLIPGGYSPDQLRIDNRAVEFCRNFVQSGKPVFSICHAPQLLVSAQVLEGRTITGWPSVKQDIINAGARYEDEEVVVDGNLVSSRSPRDLKPFVDACLEMLG